MNLYLGRENLQIINQTERTRTLLKTAKTQLRLIKIPKTIIDKFEKYSEVLEILDYERVPGLHHDLNNSISSIISYYDLITSTKNVNEIIKYTGVIINYIEQSLPSFVERRVNYLKEEWNTNRVVEIWNILGVDFINAHEKNWLEDFKKSLAKSIDLIDYQLLYHDNLFVFQKSDEKIIIDFSDSLLDTSVSHEFWIIIENLIRNSLKSYKRRKNKINQFKIDCIINRNKDWYIDFSVKDNWWWINKKQLIDNVLKKIVDSSGIILGIQERTRKILLDSLLEVDILSKITSREINELIFSYWTSGFWTSWIWLYLCREQLRKNWWDIDLQEDTNWNIAFFWTYNNQRHNNQYLN